MRNRHVTLAATGLLLAPIGASDAYAPKISSRCSSSKPFQCPTSMDGWIILAWTLKASVCLLPHSATIKTP